MKRKELTFRCFTGSVERSQEILEALNKAGIIEHSDGAHAVAVYVRPDMQVNITQDCVTLGHLGLAWQSAGDLPTVDYAEAMALIESVEPEERGMWVVRDISKDGGYSFDGEAYNWQELPRDKRAIFGGWMFPNHEGWQVIRQGDTPGAAMENHATNWVKPLIPTKIRFWVP